MVHRFFSVFFFDSFFVQTFVPLWARGRRRESFFSPGDNKTNGTCDDYYSAGTGKMHNLVIPRAR